MDDGKRLILMARTSVKLTNGSPKLGKPLADRGRSEAGPSPTDLHEFPFQSTGRCQATTWRWVLAPPHVPSSLRCHQPACWHRAEPQPLMNKPSKETWRGRAVFSFNCYDSCNWQKALWELKISALTGIMYLPPQCLQFVNTDVMIQTGIWKWSKAEFLE